MFDNYKSNDPRFTIIHSKFGRFILRALIIIVLLAAVIKIIL